MRKESQKRNANPNIKTVAFYHRSHFESLKFFNSDRAVNITDDYKVSEDNTASTLKIMRAGSPIQSYGHEMELVCDTVLDDTVLANLLDMVFKACFPDDLFRMEQDGSLGGHSSAECITQTYSKGWMRNNYKNFHTMYTYFANFGINPGHESCGQHVNIGLTNFGKTKDAQDEAIRKFWYLLANNYNLFYYAVRRDGHSTTYAGRLGEISKDQAKSMDLTRMSASHGYCLNYSHYTEGRIEFRLVGGQPNFLAFINTMETVFHLVDAVKRISWNDLDDMSKVFKGCNQFVLNRLSRCVEKGAMDVTTYNKIKATSITENFGDFNI